VKYQNVQSVVEFILELRKQIVQIRILGDVGRDGEDQIVGWGLGEKKHREFYFKFN
jgi:hypothetical protein